MTAKILIAVAIVLWPIWVCVGLMFSALSVMGFDAPGSEKMLLPWLIVASAAFWPLWSLGCIALAGYKLFHRQTRPALWTIAASLLGALPVAVLMLAGLLLGK